MTKKGVSSSERTAVSFFEQPFLKIMPEAGNYRTVPEKMDTSFLFSQFRRNCKDRYYLDLSFLRNY